jgi:flagellar biogenesis protein FliO
MSLLFLPDANMSIVLVVLGFIILFIFFVYLLLRRTAQGFKEGMEGGRQ